MDRHLSAALRYTVQGTRLGIVVVVVVFKRSHGELISAVEHENRMAQRIGHRSVFALGVQLYRFGSARRETAGTHLFLTKSVLLNTIEQLRELNLNRSMVDAVIERLVMNRIALVHFREIFERCFRQIKGLAACTGREKRSVSVGGRLYHFVLHRVQVHRIFAGRCVRTDRNTLLLKQCLRTSYRLLQRVAGQVVRVMHQMRSVVALELQHELQVIAEVVLTQTKAMWQVALIVTSGDTTDEAHFGLIIETDTVQRFVQGKSLFAVLYAQNTLAFEGMSGFENLQFVQLPFGDCQLKGTVDSGRQRSTVAANRVPVEHEHRTGYRNGAVLV